MQSSTPNRCSTISAAQQTLPDGDTRNAANDGGPRTTNVNTQASAAMSRSAANFWQWPHPPPPPASSANGAIPARTSTPSTSQGRAPTAAAFPTAATAAAAAAAAVAAAVGAGINSVMPANSAGQQTAPWWGASSRTADDSNILNSAQAHGTGIAGTPSRPGSATVPTQVQSQQAGRAGTAGGSGAGPGPGAGHRQEAEEEEEWEVVRRPVDGPGGSGQPPERMQVMRWQPPGNPALWSAVGRVASVAWSALKLCHRYVLVPAASWALNNLKAYMEEQLAIHRALAARPVPPTVIQYGDAEIRVCTDNMSSTRRALDTPYGLVSYMTTLRGREVVVVPVTLRWRADVDVFWSEVDAGHTLATQLHQQSLLAHTASTTRPSAGPGPSTPSRTTDGGGGSSTSSVPRSGPVTRYLGCCRSPGLTCHVYEHPLAAATTTPPSTSLSASGPPSTPSTSTPAPAHAAAPSGGPWSWYSLREALGPPGSPAARAGLCGWEARLAVCGQLLEAAVLMLRSGVGARRLTSSNVLLLLPAPGTDGGGMHTGAPGAAPSLPLCRLAPGCGFRLLISASTAPAAGAAAPPSSQHVGAASPAQAADARAAGAGGAEGRAGGSGATTTSSGGGTGSGSGGSSGGGGDLEVTVVGLARGLGATLFQVLLGPDAAARTPPGRLLEALAAAQPAALLDRAVVPPLTDEQAWPLLAAAYPLLAWGQERADKDSKGLGSTGGRDVRGPGGVPGSGSGGWQRQGVGSGGQGASVSDEALELVGYLLREVAPAVRELAAAVAAVTATAAHRRHGAADDPFRDASAPLLGPPGAGSPDPWVGGGGGQGQAGPSAPGPSRCAAQVESDAPSAPPAPHDAYTHAHPGFYPTVPSGYPTTASAGVGAGVGPAGGAAGVPAAAAAPPQPPTEFLCPITQDLMSDPVVCADGHSYERSAIAAWLAGGHATSPLTGARLPSAALTPNYALRSIIRDWRERHGA